MENHQLEIPIFESEEGQYLANTLGDPLIKGLTEIVEKRPSDPVSYLAAFLQNYKKSRQPRNEQLTQDHRFNVLNLLSQKPSIENESDPSKRETSPTPTSTETNFVGEDRDEHGQSLLHFACARSQGRNSIVNIIEESNLKITYRDELYRTARDVALQAGQPGNAKEIDRYVLTLAARGNLAAFENLLMDGYDHIVDIVDDQANTIIEFVRTRGFYNLASFLEDVQNLEERREELHLAIRSGNMEKIQELCSGEDGLRLAKAKNYYARTALHVAILKENEEMVEYFCNLCPPTITIGDNLERKPLHYAMGINLVETISRILIKKGAKRTVKDLKGRQPSYYFMNKADILRLQEEEEDR